MTKIRVHCRYCPNTALLRPEQVLLVPQQGGGTHLFFCPSCGRITDGPAGPTQVLLLVAAGVPFTAARVRTRRGEQP